MSLIKVCYVAVLSRLAVLFEALLLLYILNWHFDSDRFIWNPESYKNMKVKFPHSGSQWKIKILLKHVIKTPKRGFVNLSSVSTRTTDRGRLHIFSVYFNINFSSHKSRHKWNTSQKINWCLLSNWNSLELQGARLSGLLLSHKDARSQSHGRVRTWQFFFKNLTNILLLI